LDAVDRRCPQCKSERSACSMTEGGESGNRSESERKPAGNRLDVTA
jgi:hypothetical protein